MIENKLGLNVRTFRDVVIRESELGDNVVIGDDAFISGSKIAASVIVERRKMMFDSKVGFCTSIGWNSVIRNADIGKFVLLHGVALSEVRNIRCTI